MIQKLKNFWIQPCKGFTERSRGRTVAELDAHEAAIGFALPARYRALLRQQNGGVIRYCCLNGTELFQLSVLSGIPQPNDVYPITRFQTYVEVTCEAEEVERAVAAMTPLHLDRLVIFSGLDGHSTACLDYGYRQLEARLEPEVCFFTDDGDAFLHFAEFGPRFSSFDAFLAALTVDPDATETRVGVFSALAFEDLFEQLRTAWGLSLTVHRADDRNGWFNFDQWYSGPLPLTLSDAHLADYARANNQELADVLAWADAQTPSDAPGSNAQTMNQRVRRIHAIFSPNQHLSGTYLDQAHPTMAMIIEIPRAWFDPEEPLLDKLRALQLDQPALELRWLVCA